MKRKRCQHCRKEKPIEEFYKNRRERDGFDYYCKKCRAKLDRKYRSRKYPLPGKLYKNKKWLKKELKNKSPKEIANECNVAKSTIYRYLNKFNINWDKYKRESIHDPVTIKDKIFNFFNKISPDIKVRKCFKCKRTLSLKKFKTNSCKSEGYGYICKRCHSEYYKKWYKENGRKRNPKTQKAGLLLRKAIEENKIQKPDKCEICDIDDDIRGHHYNYNKPYDVIWICRKCHKQIHSEGLEKEEDIEKIKKVIL